MAVDIPALIADYEQGLPIRELGSKHKITYYHAQRLLLHAGVKIRTRKETLALGFYRRTRRYLSHGPHCVYCGMRLELVRVVHEEHDGQSCDICYHHVRHLPREPQGVFFWRDSEKLA